MSWESWELNIFRVIEWLRVNEHIFQSAKQSNKNKPFTDRFNMSELQPCTNAVPNSCTAVIIQYNHVITDSKEFRLIARP